MFRLFRRSKKIVNASKLPMTFYNLLTARIHLSTSRRVLSGRYEFTSRDILEGRYQRGDRWNRAGRGAYDLERKQPGECACRTWAFLGRLTSSVIGALHFDACLRGLSFPEYALAVVLTDSAPFIENPQRCRTRPGVHGLVEVEWVHRKRTKGISGGDCCGHADASDAALEICLVAPRGQTLGR